MATHEVATYSLHPTKIWLKPNLPLNSNVATRELFDGNDLAPSLENVMCWVIPDKLDPHRFRNALEKALSIFPTFAGRLQKSANGYQISYGGPGLPVQFSQINVVAHPAAQGREDIVSQDSRTIAPFVDANPFTSLALEDDTPLVTLKLTYVTKTGRTVMGISFSQTAADGPTIKFFTHAISQFYQGLELSNRPLYSSHKWATPTDRSESANGINGHGASSVTLEDLNQQLWGGDTEGSSLLQIFFTPQEVKALMNRIHQETNNSLSRVSVQDAIVAYAVNLYNSFIINDPITTVRFILTYRRRDPEESSRYRDANNVGNGIYFLEAPVAELPGLADKASAFRKAIVHSRERPNLEALISARSALGFEMMQKRQIMPWSVPGMTLVNGLHHFDYAEEASFGYPGRAQAYYSSCCCRYLTLTKPNPVQLADGSWKWHVGDVGVGIPVPDGLKEKMLQQKAQDMEGLLHSF